MGIISRLFNREGDESPEQSESAAVAQQSSDPSTVPSEPPESVTEIAELESIEPPPSLAAKPPPPPRKAAPPSDGRPDTPSPLPPLELPDPILPSEPPESDPFAGIVSELDARFDASRRQSDAPVPAAGEPAADAVTTADDMGSVRQLFGEMAVPFMSQVRDFMLELRHTDASTAWIEMCEPAVQSMRATCEPLDMPELGVALDEFAALLRQAKDAPSGRVDGELRERLLACHRHMIELLPEAFEVGAGREPVIVRLLLLQVPGVYKLTLDKLYRAGLHQIDAFLHGKPDEIAAVAGIELGLAERIVRSFREYRERVESVITQFTPGEEYDRLRELVARLREQHQAFETARAGWSEQALQDKKRLRRERGETQSNIYVALARLGEVELIDVLQRYSVERQLEELERYLAQHAGERPA